MLMELGIAEVVLGAGKALLETFQVWLQGQSLQVQQRQHQESLEFQRQAQQIQDDR